MKVVDLGTLDAPVLVFGGPYSNRQALDALIAQAAMRGIPPARCLCTGDVVAYGADPAGTVATIRAFGCPVVAGNCEIQLAAGAADCGCGFDAGSTCDLLSRGWFAHATASLDAEARRWMAGLPQIVTFTSEGRRVAAIHGGAEAVNAFLWPTDADAAFMAEIATLERRVGPLDMVLAGHCGLGFVREIGAVTWVNAGAIGLPAHDGRRETAFALIGAGPPRLLPLGYDAEGAAAEMRAAGLTQGYDRALLSGYWPSEDVLPSALRRASAESG